MAFKIPYGRQNITQEDIDAVVETLKHDFLTQGPKVQEFEEKFAEYVGAKYACAVSNGTAALHLAGLALGAKKGQKIITTPITFAATANSMLYCGAEVEFVDINPDTYLIDLDLVEDKLRSHPKGTFSGVIPVDFTGLPINSERLRKLADKYDLWIIEDACHAPGGYFNDSKGTKVYCGNGTYSDLTCFSFHPVKHIACGEGGMITTNNKELHTAVMRLRTHGIRKDNMIENHGGWYHEMHDLGYNYRLPDINCALGVTQLKKADAGMLRRHEIADKYREAFKGLNFVKTQKQPEGSFNAYHLFVIEVEQRKKTYDYLRENGIFAQIHYIPTHLHPYYQKLGWKKGDFPHAEKYYENCISLPMFPTLTDEEQDYVIEKIKESTNL
jgi:UDP-4-amino-4,6-dideoxy-N-acetyl-beta-L-altrosamine transaminase